MGDTNGIVALVLVIAVVMAFFGWLFLDDFRRSARWRYLVNRSRKPPSSRTEDPSRDANPDSDRRV